MIDKIKISAVSYLNTLPFVYGIKNSGLLSGCELQLDIPSVCARKFIDKDVDVALVPAAALINIPEYKLLNEFCIGSDGNVRTVLLLSQCPVYEIKKVHLDYHSLTSVSLMKILAYRLWKIHPYWVNLNKDTENDMGSFESVVAIGDKTFSLVNKFRYVYDLSGEWNKFCNLPFVFACWIAQENVSDLTVEKINAALRWGVNNKRQAIDGLFDKKSFPDVDIDKYLEKNIDFIFDERKHEALRLFHVYLTELKK